MIFAPSSSSYNFNNAIETISGITVGFELHMYYRNYINLTKSNDQNSKSAMRKNNIEQSEERTYEVHGWKIDTCLGQSNVKRLNILL